MSDIGYWIDPLGAAHEIGHGSHHQWMRRMRGIADQTAEERGWHRVRVVPGGALFSYGQVALTAEQTETAERLMREHGALHHQECTVPLSPPRT
jgi:hypothetical protein